MIDLPGHSPGSIGLAVETDAGLAVLTGDAMHTAQVAVSGRSPLVFYNESQANESIAKAVAAGDVLYPGHDRPFRLAEGRPVYTEPFALTLTNLQADMDGLTMTVPQPGEPWIMPGIEDQPTYD